MKQRTIKNAISITGIGLHSGERCTLKLTPAAVNSGIMFFLSMNAYKMFEYKAENVCNTMLATSVGSSDCFVSTVEHLAACLQIMHITNIGIAIEGPELPILDGSAYPFHMLLQCAEIDEQNEEAPILYMQEFIQSTDQSHFISCEPFVTLAIQYEWFNPLTKEFDVVNVWFDGEHKNEFTKMYKAKTFCSFDDVEKLRVMGLIKGGNENNAIVYKKSKVLNPKALCYSGKDFVYHKIIDFLGDLAQLSTNIKGKFYVRNSGHALNNAFCRAYSKFIAE